MRVIIDSNQVIQRDWFLSGPAFQELLRASERGHIELIIPQIVFDEITNKYRELALDAQRNLKKISREADHLHISLGFDLDDTRIDEESARYETQFREKINRHKVKLTPYPDVTHDVIAWS